MSDLITPEELPKWVPGDLTSASDGLGLWSFNRRFRETFGGAPYAFVIGCRIIRARSLIESSNQPLQQIAAACGFNDKAHMTRLFKARVQTTPGALRRESLR